MYEKEIEELEWMRSAKGCFESTLETTIALMKAARPKDAEAEREHVRRALIVALNDNDLPRDEWLLRERAAARAEVEARFVAERAELCILRKDRDDWKARALAAEAEKKP